MSLSVQRFLETPKSSGLLSMPHANGPKKTLPYGWLPVFRLFKWRMCEELIYLLALQFFTKRLSLSIYSFEHVGDYDPT